MSVKLHEQEISTSCEAGIWWFSDKLKQTTEDRILEELIKAHKQLEEVEKQLKIINKKLNGQNKKEDTRDNR